MLENKEEMLVTDVLHIPDLNGNIFPMKQIQKAKYNLKTKVRILFAKIKF